MRLDIDAVDASGKEYNVEFDDGEHIVYVNGTDKDASAELGKLMHDCLYGSRRFALQGLARKS